MRLILEREEFRGLIAQGIEESIDYLGHVASVLIHTAPNDSDSTKGEIESVEVLFESSVLDNNGSSTEVNLSVANAASKTTAKEIVRASKSLRPVKDWAEPLRTDSDRPLPPLFKPLENWEVEPVAALTLSDLCVSTRTRNAFVAGGIENVADAKAAGDERLRAIHNIGIARIHELKNAIWVALEKHGS